MTARVQPTPPTHSNVPENYLNEVQKPDEDDSQTTDAEELVLPF